MSTTRVRRVASAERAWLGLCLCWCVAALGCAQDADSWDPAVEPPHLARAVPRQAVTWEYVLGPASRAGLSFGGRQHPVTGSVAVSSGKLWVDAHDLSATRAALTFDLRTLVVDETRSPPPAVLTEAASLTEQSLNWLQAGTSSASAARPELRFAHFSLVSIGSASHEDVADAPGVPGSPSGVTARRVRLRASGELELHGYRLPCTVSLVATFEWATAERGAPPRRIELATTEPVSIDLLGHGVLPRDARGDVLAAGLAALRQLPRHSIQLEARWVAELGSAPTLEQAP